ncbi:MAG: hypothetical protein ACYCOU_23190 [Sulfobacillus sp.]
MPSGNKGKALVLHACVLLARHWVFVQLLMSSKKGVLLKMIELAKQTSLAVQETSFHVPHIASQVSESVRSVLKPMV